MQKLNTGKAEAVGGRVRATIGCSRVDHHLRIVNMLTNYRISKTKEKRKKEASLNPIIQLLSKTFFTHNKIWVKSSLP